MGQKRLRVAVRNQVQMRFESVDQALPPDHPVRVLWAFVASLDLSAFLARVVVAPGRPGAPAFDPRTLITLWLQATLDGVGSARRVSDLCRDHLVYRWICGDDPVCYRTLSTFRVDAADALDELLTQSAAALCHAGLASLDRVAQDGLRVRASAGAGSFHREKTLGEHLAEAQEQVRVLKTQVDEDPGAASRRAHAARERGAADRVTRLTAALETLGTLRAENAARAASAANAHRAKPADQLRASGTDPEARKMKMPDGGFRPAFNVQFATTTVGGVVVGVGVTNDGTDMLQLEPMVDQLRARYGRAPAQILVDNGFASLDPIAAVEKAGTQVFAPVKDEGKQLAAGRDPYARKKGDAPEVARWRARMGTAAGKEIYQERGPTAEWANAGARNRGLYRFTVRGLKRTGVVATWFAVAHNASRAMASGQWTP